MADAFADLSKHKRIEKAVAACTQERNPLSATKAAKIYRIAPSTITRRINEQSKSKKAVNQSKQLLTPVEERTLVKWIIQYYKWGLPLAFKQIRRFACEILARKNPQPQSSQPSISDQWHRKLLQRHPEIKRVSARGLDRVRASAANVDTIQEYFELYRSLQQKYSISPQDTYNMDEKGFCMGAIQRSTVVIPVTQRDAFLRQDGNREWVSVIETISASGETLSSYIIFKAVYQQSSWHQQLDSQSSKIATSSKGWTDNHLGLLWLREHFEVETAKRQIGEYRMLLLDGHESHCTLEFIDFCVQKKIILLVLPPHTTHLLQPLDVVIFSLLARYYSAEIEEHSREKHYWLEKKDFIIYYQNARKKTLRESNIHSAWRATGLMPYNPQSVISKLPIRATTPSEATQIQLVLNGSPLNLLVGADEDYITKATQAIKDTMSGSPAQHCMRTIEYLNANNAILHTTNARLVAAARSRKESRKAKKALGKARALGKEDADKLQADTEAKEAAEKAQKIAIGQKKKEQALKKAQEEAARAERAIQRALTKKKRQMDAEIARLTKIKDSLFT